MLGCIGNVQERTHRYNTRKADWNLFNTSLISALSRSVLANAANVNDKVLAMTQIVKHAADFAIPKSGFPRASFPPWWSRELADMRIALRKASRSRYRPGGGYTIEYIRARNTYLSAIRLAKLESWKRYCSDGSTSTWSPLYKWLRKGTIRADIPTSLIKTDGSPTTSIAETAEVLLEFLIPNDPDSFLVPSSPSTSSQPPVLCSSEDLITALWKCSPSRAPGMDNFTAKIIRKSWHVISSLSLF